MSAVWREAEKWRHADPPTMLCADTDHHHGLAWAAWRASSAEQAEWIVLLVN